MQLIHFDVESEEELNAELESRGIDYTMVQNVESYFHSDERDVLRVWYWYQSELIT